MVISIKDKKLLCEFQNFTCEICKKVKNIESLDIHRINRGYNGGTYTDHRNLKVVCYDCHKLIHSGEFGHVSHSY